MSTGCVYPDVFTVLKSSRLIILGKPAFKNKLPCFCFIYLVMDLKTKAFTNSHESFRKSQA